MSIMNILICVLLSEKYLKMLLKKLTRWNFTSSWSFLLSACNIEDLEKKNWPSTFKKTYFQHDLRKFILATTYKTNQYQKNKNPKYTTNPYMQRYTKTETGAHSHKTAYNEGIPHPRQYISTFDTIYIWNTNQWSF